MQKELCEVQIERASANCVSVSGKVYGSISAKVLPAYDSTKACSSPRLGDELVEHIVGDPGLSCLDAIAHPCGRRDTFFQKKEPVLRKIQFPLHSRWLDPAAPIFRFVVLMHRTKSY